MEMNCVHHYIVQSISEDGIGKRIRQLTGVCKYCGESKLFPVNPLSPWEQKREKAGEDWLKTLLES